MFLVIVRSRSSEISAFLLTVFINVLLIFGRVGGIERDILTEQKPTKKNFS